SFTGALRDHKGRFELADGGTIFLDEIGDMSSRLQVKLLRVIQERAFEPVGGTETISVNVRIVAATSRNLKEEIAQGRFRQDLYYRLNVVPIHLPPLRERRSDISMLMNHFLDKFNRQNHKKVTRLSREVLDMLLDYPWPGNIRELENCIERAVVLSHGDTLAADLLPAEVRERRSAAAAASSDGRTAANALAEIGVLAAAVCETSDNLAESRRALLESVESAALRTALKRETSQRELAIQFGMSRMTLRGRLKRYGLDRPGIHGLNV
ncbi:MAG: sigma-54-dependent Fis family transcriptional regulator, partial [Kiritimatiellae bacterium]|nr:sigma-54-dependent Fis family transcriptional regulator [Kiritimatiellia bacterium]